MANILVKHQTGSKANQTEVFDLANFTEINFGRGDSVQVKYGDQDDLVSRQHAKITRDLSNPNQFFITDSSRNGTFVNALRINAGTPAQINHGDRIQFGTGGSEFIFELDPPPANSARETRILSDTNNSQATREVPAGTREVQPRSEGRLTSLERRIEEERNSAEQRMADERQILNARIMQESLALNAELEREKNNSRWRTIYIGLALFVVVALSGTGFYIWKTNADVWKLKTEAELKTSQNQLSTVTEIADEANKKLTKIEAIKTPEQISKAYSSSTVFIESNWELVNETGNKMYQVYLDNKGKLDANGIIPVYQLYEDEQGKQHIDPLLTDKPYHGRLFSGKEMVSGSGFAISDNGFILTNRHVAASWRYLDDSDLNKENAILYDSTKDELVKFTDKQRKMLDRWRASGSQIFTKSCSINMQTTNKGWKNECVPARINGRHITLTVTFPKTTDAFAARLVKESEQADVALLKIDTVEPIQSLPPLDSEEVVNQGESVTALGYPGSSSKTFVEKKSSDIFRPDSSSKEIPEPTLSNGVISKITKRAPDAKLETQNNYVGEMDAYELTINSTGSGNSGGPVFNSKGQVIGIYTYASGRASIAIPIKYGRDLKMNRSEL